MNLCPRCSLGDDNDHDGDCGVCASLSDAQIRYILTAETMELYKKFRNTLDARYKRAIAFEMIRHRQGAKI